MLKKDVRPDNANYNEIPILTYHKVLFKKEIDEILLPRDRIYSLPVSEFEKHCKYLTSHGYRALSFKEIKKALNGHDGLGPKCVVLTFDDGSEDHFYRAFPVLLKYSLKATFFIPTDLIGTAGHLNWNQIQEMHQAGMEFQSHTHTHVNLEKLDEAGINTELTISKGIIETKLNNEVFVLSLPYGLGDFGIKELALSTGYCFVCTSEWGANEINCETFILRRLPIKLHDDLARFKSFVELRKSLLFYYRAKKTPFVLARRMLGKGLYDSIRDIILNRT